MAAGARAPGADDAADRELAERLLGDRGIDVSRETWARLAAMAGLLRRWQATINLVAPSTLPQIWTRHIADSLQLLPLMPATLTLVDLGSGAGFPGLVLAVALSERPGARVHLVESDQRKAAFLREAARITGAAAVIHAVRIEQFAADFRGRADMVTARALAPLPRLLDMAAPFLEKGAEGLFLKGREAQAELTESGKYWHMDAELLVSLTDPLARIVRVRSVERIR